MLEHARTPGTGKFKILKLGCTLFFPFQFSVSWDFPGTLRQGALAADHRADTLASSTEWIFTLQQQAGGAHSGTPGTQQTLQENTSLQFIQ